MVKKYLSLALICACMPVFTITGAYAAHDKPNLENEDMNDRLDKLERSFIKLQHIIYGQKTSAVTNHVSSKEMHTEWNDVTEQIKTIKGNIEQLQYELIDLNNKLVDLSNEMKLQINEIKQNLHDKQIQNKTLNNMELQLDDNLVGKSSSDQAAIQQKRHIYKQDTSVGASFLAKSPDEQYQHAYSLLQQKNYEEAKEAFIAFLNHNSDDKLLSKAHYWLGEIYTQQQNDEKAAIEFLRGYQRDPSGYKAPDNLLKLGVTLSHLGKQREACVALLKLQREFPNANNSIKDKAQAEVSQLYCE